MFCPFLSGQSGTIKIFNLSARKERLCLTDHTDVVRTLSFGPDGHTLCSGSDDSKIIIWETTNGQFKASNNMHSLGILKVRPLLQFQLGLEMFSFEIWLKFTDQGSLIGN